MNYPIKGSIYGVLVNFEKLRAHVLRPRVPMAIAESIWEVHAGRFSGFP